MAEALLLVSRKLARVEADFGTWPWPDGTHLKRRRDFDLPSGIAYFVSHPDIPDGAQYVNPVFRTVWDEEGRVATMSEFVAWNPVFPEIVPQMLEPGPGPEPIDLDAEPIHAFFGLTYANYLVLQRSFLQSMPEDWQHQFVHLLNQLQARADAWAARECVELPEFQVTAKGEHGRYMTDPVPHYNRGRTKLDMSL